jgi:hypothetical protein
MLMSLEGEEIGGIPVAQKVFRSLDIAKTGDILFNQSTEDSNLGQNEILKRKMGRKI